MGLNKLGPVIKSQQDVHSDTALSGWYQGEPAAERELLNRTLTVSRAGTTSRLLHVRRLRYVSYTLFLSRRYQLSVSLHQTGLNYLRLASAPRFALLDKIILVVQASMHVFTVVKMTDVPPKVLSVIMLGALGLGCLQ